MINKKDEVKNTAVIKKVMAAIQEKSTALEFGSCSVVLTFHSGQITKTEVVITETQKID